MTSQYQPYIPDKCHTVITVFKLFHKYEARLWKCYHVTMNSSYFLLFAKLTQLWCNVVIPTSRRGCEFDAAVAMLYWCCHCNIITCSGVNLLSSVEGNVGTRLWIDAIVLVLWRPCEFDVTMSTSQQRCQYNVHSTPWDKLTIQR